MSQSIKKRLGVIVLVLISILGITSCAKTPKEKVVADKSEGLAKESILPKETDKPKDLGIPKHWKETLDRSDGFVTLEADCDTNIPEIYNIPVYSYEMASLKKDWLSRLCGYFAKGDKLYEYPEMTKDELRKEKEKIANYEGRWATWSKGGQLITYWEGMLKTMDELIEKAPQERAENKYIEANLGVPYQTEKDYFNEVSDYYYDTDDKIGLTARVDRGRECDPVIRAVDYDDKVGSTTKFVYSQGTFVDEIDLAELEFDNAESTEAYDEWLGRLREEADADVGLTQEEALKKVDKMLKNLSIKGFEVSDCVKAVGNEDTESWALLEEAGLEKSVGYSVYLYRKAGDVIGYSQRSPMIYDDLPETVYAPYFSAEKIRAIITEDGIQRFEWTDISKKKDTIADNTKLLSFQKIQEKLADHLLYGALADGGEELKSEGAGYLYKVRKVQLRAANINAYEEPSAAWMVPVWVFDLERTGVTGTGENLGWGTETVVLNAIDGGYVTIPNE